MRNSQRNLGVLHTQEPDAAPRDLDACAISAIIGIFGVALYFCGGAAVTDDTIKALPHNIWYSFGIFPHDAAANIPQSLLVVTLISNFGTFLLYMMTCIIAIVASASTTPSHGFKHMLVPVFGLLANLACMLFYLIGPFSVAGMSWKEPYIALGIAAVWGIYGAFYFHTTSKKKAKSILVEQSPSPA